MLSKDKLPYTQLIDPNDAKTALLFGIEQLPSSYLTRNIDRYQSNT
jgi:hypothetical protein